jgi:hypothetical protein
LLVEEVVNADAATVLDELLLADRVAPLAEEIDAELEDFGEVPHRLATHLVLVVGKEVEKEL